MKNKCFFCQFGIVANIKFYSISFLVFYNLDIPVYLGKFFLGSTYGGYPILIDLIEELVASFPVRIAPTEMKILLN